MDRRTFNTAMITAAALALLPKGAGAQQLKTLTEVYREAIGTAGMAGLAGRGRTGLNRGAGSHESLAAAGKRAAAGRL